MIDNNKLAKELASIYSSSNKAKKSVTAELAKIDEKYRKLAEQEKAQLNKTLAMLESQLAYYGAILGLDKPVDVKPDEPAQDLIEITEEEEEAIEDTIFPDNNEEIEENEVENSEEDETEEPAEPADDAAEPAGDNAGGDGFSDIWPDEPAQEAGEEAAKESDVEEEEENEDEWPSFPEEWK